MIFSVFPTLKLLEIKCQTAGAVPGDNTVLRVGDYKDCTLTQLLFEARITKNYIIKHEVNEGLYVQH